MLVMTQLKGITEIKNFLAFTRWRCDRRGPTEEQPLLQPSDGRLLGTSVCSCLLVLVNSCCQPLQQRYSANQAV